MTTGTQNFGIVHPNIDDKKILAEDQKQYHLGMEMLLYLVKHSCPDIANALQELSKVLDGAKKAAYKEMHQIIKYVFDSRVLGLKIEPIQGRNESQDWSISVTVIMLEFLTVGGVSLLFYFMHAES